MPKDLQDEIGWIIVGEVGRVGKLPKEFGGVNSIDCRRRGFGDTVLQESSLEAATMPLAMA